MGDKRDRERERGQQEDAARVPDDGGDDTARQGASAFAALADPTRRSILRMLRAGSKNAGEIAEAFHLTKPTLSHHFRVLRGAGLVRAERRGTSIVYTLQTNVLEDLATEIMDLAAPLKRAKRAST